MEKEITEKLGAFLEKRGSLFQAESDVVYFLVEARKVLEHQKSSKIYKILRFYIDWALHTKKDRYFVDEVREMLTMAHLSIPSSKISFDFNKLEDFFLDFRKLRKDMNEFLKKNDMPTDLTAEDFLWDEFARTYTDIISDQSIELPVESRILVISINKNDHTQTIKASWKEETL